MNWLKIVVLVIALACIGTGGLLASQYRIVGHISSSGYGTDGDCGIIGGVGQPIMGTSSNPRLMLSSGLSVAHLAVVYAGDAGRQEELGPSKAGVRTVLHQNYPNPFNQSTIIRYEVAQQGRVNLAIYDVRGSLVKVLETRDHEAGPHEVHWNGLNERGQRVSSGVYFCRLVSGRFTQTRKMLLK